MQTLSVVYNHTHTNHLLSTNVGSTKYSSVYLGLEDVCNYL